jgi:hypothetical protein
MSEIERLRKENIELKEALKQCELRRDNLLGKIVEKALPADNHVHNPAPAPAVVQPTVQNQAVTEQPQS